MNGSTSGKAGVAQTSTTSPNVFGIFGSLIHTASEDEDMWRTSVPSKFDMGEYEAVSLHRISPILKEPQNARRHIDQKHCLS